MTETHEQRVERLARAICAADPHVPDPDAAILWGMEECRAWEARVPLARAIIASDREAGYVTVPRALRAILEEAKRTDNWAKVTAVQIVIEAAKGE